LQQRNPVVAVRRRRLLEGSIAPALITLAIPIILGNALQSGRSGRLTEEDRETAKVTAESIIEKGLR
jgi:hypothetical protein